MDMFKGLLWILKSYSSLQIHLKFVLNVPLHPKLYTWEMLQHTYENELLIELPENTLTHIDLVSSCHEIRALLLTTTEKSEHRKVVLGVTSGRITCLYSWTSPPVITATGMSPAIPNCLPTNQISIQNRPGSVSCTNSLVCG